MMKLASAARWAAAAALVMYLAVFETGTAAAQSAPSDRKQAEEALRAGLTAQKSRKHTDAVRLFTQAIGSGALGRKELTFALYRRAVSHRADKRPAQAISDLNSALYFADVLSSADKAGALKERERAYGDAGLAAPPLLAPAAATASASPPASAGEAKSPAGARARAVAPRASLSNLPPTTPILGTGPLPAETPRRTSTATGRGQAAAAPGFTTRVTAQPVESRSGRSAGARGTVVAPPASSGGWSVATRRPPAGDRARTTAPAASAWNSSADRQPEGVQAGSSNAVSAFFSNLFGGTSTAGATRKPVVTGTLPSATAWAPRGPRDPATGDASDWATTAKLSTIKAAPSSGQVKRTVQARRVIQASGTGASGTGASRTGANRTGASRTGANRTGASRTGASRTGASRTGASRTVAGGSGFDIAVATVSSRQRAEALAKRLTAQYAGSPSWTGRSARVAAFPASGDRAALYSVRLGTYADKGALASQCEKLIADGFECQVISSRN